MAEAVTSVLIKLADILREKVGEVQAVRGQIEQVQKELCLIQALLRDVDSKCHRNNVVTEWLNQVREIAERIATVIDTFRVKIEEEKREDSSKWITKKLKEAKRNYQMYMLDLPKELKKIEEELNWLYQRRTDLRIEDLGAIDPKPCDDVDDPEVVGLEVDQVKIIEQLPDSSILMCMRLSIAGIGNLGKTTLARKVYNRYDEETRQFDENIKGNSRDRLEEHILQMTHSRYVLYQIRDDILYSFDPEGYGSLTVKEFNIKLPLILEGKLARYDEETRQFDENIKGNFRDRLEEHILQRFKPTFEDNLFRLSNEILTLAKTEVHRQLCKLPVLNQQSAIGVLRPYLRNFDDNSCADVHPYFQEVLNKHRKQFVEGLTKIGEKKGNKILIALRAAGASVACVKLIIGTTWAICTGDIVGAVMLYRNAIGRN